MQTKHQGTLAALNNCHSYWIRWSASNPTPHMSDFVIKLHLLVLRNRGEL